ncbi:phosphopantetheine-binding protein [Escherichia coli]
MPMISSRSGGHSLLAMKLAAQLSRQFAVR